jgi:hypothetical protein
MPSPYPDIVTVWGSVAGEFTYVIGYNVEKRQWLCTAKRSGGREQMIPLGLFQTALECQNACELHNRKCLQ